MIDIKIQLITIFISFTFGILFSIQLDYNHRYLNCEKKIYKIIFTFMFILANTLFYFILLKKFNNGILHPYGILSIIVGIIVEISLKTFIVKHIKK